MGKTDRPKMDEALTRVLEDIDSDGTYPMHMVAFYSTPSMKIRYERDRECLSIFLPEIFRTAPPTLIRSQLRGVYKRSKGLTIGHNTSHAEIASWVYSREFIYTYRRQLMGFNLAFFRIKALTPDSEVWQCARDALQLLPEYRKELRMLMIGVRVQSLPPSMYPVASTSIPGQIIALDPCLVSEGTPRALLRFTILHEMVKIVTHPGDIGKVSNSALKLKKELIIKFKGYEKVVKAFEQLRWFLEGSELVCREGHQVRITGRDVMWDSSRDRDKDSLSQPIIDGSGISEADA